MSPALTIEKLIECFVEELNSGADSIGAMNMDIHGIAARWGLRANISRACDGARRIEIFPVGDSESIGAVLEQDDDDLGLPHWEVEP